MKYIKKKKKKQSTKSWKKIQKEDENGIKKK